MSDKCVGGDPFQSAINAASHAIAWDRDPIEAMAKASRDYAAGLSEPAEADGGAERCRRCGHENAAWCAPSPLWNAVMRSGCINGEPEFGDLVCAACFMELAVAKGIATLFRVTAERVNVPLQTETPSGRRWDDERQLWADMPAEAAGPALAPINGDGR